MRFYLRGRLGRHLGWVLPVGGTRPMSHRPRRPATRAQKVAAGFVAIMVGLLVFVVCVGALGGH